MRAQAQSIEQGTSDATSRALLHRHLTFHYMVDADMLAVLTCVAEGRRASWRTSCLASSTRGRRCRWPCAGGGCGRPAAGSRAAAGGFNGLLPCLKYLGPPLAGRPAARSRVPAGRAYALGAWLPLGCIARGVVRAGFGQEQYDLLQLRCVANATACVPECCKCLRGKAVWASDRLGLWQHQAAWLMDRWVWKCMPYITFSATMLTWLQRLRAGCLAATTYAAAAPVAGTSGERLRV